MGPPPRVSPRRSARARFATRAFPVDRQRRRPRRSRGRSDIRDALRDAAPRRRCAGRSRCARMHRARARRAFVEVGPGRGARAGSLRADRPGARVRGTRRSRRRSRRACRDGLAERRHDRDERGRSTGRVARRDRRRAGHRPRHRDALGGGAAPRSRSSGRDRSRAEAAASERPGAGPGRPCRSLLGRAMPRRHPDRGRNH